MSAERRTLAILLGLAAGLGTMGAGLVGAAQTQGLEWALPTGTVLIVAGTTVGATVGAYRVALRDGSGDNAASAIGGTYPNDDRRIIGGGTREDGDGNADPGG